MVTLVIIGVVAAMTLPVITVNYQKKATTAQLKKTYSTFTNALRRASVDNGEDFYYDCDISSYQAIKEFAETYLFPYLNVGQVCEYGEADACNHNITYRYSGTKSIIPFNRRKDSGFLFTLADGSSIMLSSVVGKFTTKDYGDGLWVDIDLNGAKKPNIMGRDVFMFEIVPTSRGTLEFRGLQAPIFSKQSREHCKKHCKEINPRFCSVLVMRDGLEIKDDYPW